MKQRLYANPIVGRTGLGNMLFPWARAEVFCKQTGAKMLAPQWVNLFRIGPWIRFERDKRYYVSNFSNAGYIQGVHRQYVLRTVTHIGETEVAEKPMVIANGPQIVDFKGMEGFFSPFLSAQEYIKERIYAITSLPISEQLKYFSPEPFIGVHIRRGDFQSGGQSIEDDWYVHAIEHAAKSVGTTKWGGLVRIFSDAAPEKLRFLTETRTNVILMPKAPALLDILILSQCMALVGTSRSTFSMWAAFLGQMPSFWHPCERPPLLSSKKEAVATVLDFSKDMI